LLQIQFLREMTCLHCFLDTSISAEAVTLLQRLVSSCVRGKFSTVHLTSLLICQGTCSQLFLANYSYSVFLSSIAGVIFCDYYAVRKGYFSVPYLYSADRDGPYWYLGGINPKAYVSPPSL